MNFTNSTPVLPDIGLRQCEEETCYWQFVFLIAIICPGFCLGIFLVGKIIDCLYMLCQRGKRSEELYEMESNFLKESDV